jgi:hypothetical protein
MSHQVRQRAEFRSITLKYRAQGIKFVGYEISSATSTATE